MKHTLEEIEERTKNPGISYESVGKQITVTPGFVRSLLEVKEIITDLVEEVKEQRKDLEFCKLHIGSLEFANKGWSKTYDEETFHLRKENKRLREALIGLLEEYENQKSQFGDHGLWIKYELIEKVSLARKALEGE